MRPPDDGLVAPARFALEKNRASPASSPSMRLRLPFTLALLFSLPALAGDSAYTALRVLGRQDKDMLNRVVEMRGLSGAPQPDAWKISVDEPRARGGIREYEIRRGKIVSERTPIGRPLGAAMNFNQLNLDSEGVFTLANQEAQKAAVAFDRMDYLLKAGTGGGAPVWDVQLLEGRENTGRMTIAADSGTVLQRQFTRAPRGPRRDPEFDRDPLDRRPLPPPPEDDARWQQSDGRWSQPGESFRGIDDFFHRLTQRAERRSEKLKNFFTGESPGR